VVVSVDRFPGKHRGAGRTREIRSRLRRKKKWRWWGGVVGRGGSIRTAGGGGVTEDSVEKPSLPAESEGQVVEGAYQSIWKRQLKRSCWIEGNDTRLTVGSGVVARRIADC